MLFFFQQTISFIRVVPPLPLPHLRTRCHYSDEHKDLLELRLRWEASSLPMWKHGLGRSRVAVRVELAGMCNGAHLFTLGRPAPIPDELLEIRRLALRRPLSSALHLQTPVWHRSHGRFVECNPSVAILFIDKFIHFELLDAGWQQALWQFSGSLCPALIIAHGKENQTMATLYNTAAHNNQIMLSFDLERTKSSTTVFTNMCETKRQTILLQ